MKRKLKLLLPLVLLAGLAAATATRADDDEGEEGGRPAARAPMLPAYQEECGACHVPYPARLLPSDSWQHLMMTLPTHFHTDASLDAATAQKIAAWLKANAGTGRGRTERPPEDRITLSPWFLREHDEVSAATWKRPAIKNASNCAACHTKAAEGDFRERNIRIPR